MQAELMRVEMEKRVSEILFYVWDPVGVQPMPSCRDEYEDYVPLVSAYLLHNFTETGVDFLLMYIMEEYIGIGFTNAPRRKYQHLEAMRMLMEWKQDFFLKHPDFKSAAPKFPKDESFLDQIGWSRKCTGGSRNIQTNATGTNATTKT